MGISRTIRCQCGGVYQKQLVPVEGLRVEAMVCPRCNNETFTMTQARELGKLMRLQRLVGRKRKIIRIGSSLAVTVPKACEELGWKAGKAVHWKQVDKKSFEVVIE